MIAFFGFVCEPATKLKAVLFFNNSEGKGSSGLDESLGGHRVELYLVCALNKKAACGRRKHAMTVCPNQATELAN